MRHDEYPIGTQFLYLNPPADSALTAEIVGITKTQYRLFMENGQTLNVLKKGLRVVGSGIWDNAYVTPVTEESLSLYRLIKLRDRAVSLTNLLQNLDGPLRRRLKNDEAKMRRFVDALEQCLSSLREIGKE